MFAFDVFVLTVIVEHTRQHCCFVGSFAQICVLDVLRNNRWIILVTVGAMEGTGQRLMKLRGCLLVIAGLVRVRAGGRLGLVTLILSAVCM